MRLPGKTIPAAFTLQDTHTNAADSFANAEDMRTERLNHNILIAARVRKPIIAMACTAPIGIGRTYGPWILKTRVVPSWRSIPQISTMLYVQQTTQKVRFKMRASKTALAGGGSPGSPSVYVAIVDPVAGAEMIPIDTYAMTITAATDAPGTYFVDVNLPHLPASNGFLAGLMAYRLFVYVRSILDTTNPALHAAFAITDVGSNWFTSAIPGNGHDNDMVYVDSDPMQDARKIVHEVAVGGGAYRDYIDSAWERIPQTTDTLTILEILGVELYSYSVYEIGTTDFDEELGP